MGTSGETTELDAEMLPPIFDADACLARAAWQRVLFPGRLRRAEILDLVPTWGCRPLRVHVLRNQPFEFVGSVLATFVAYAGYELRLTVGDYDDALSDLRVGSADVAIVWLDFGRYRDGPAEVVSWLAQRLAALRESTEASVLVHNQAPGASPDDGATLNEALGAALGGLPDVHVVDQAAIAHDLGPAYLDERAARITGFTLSDAACLETARHLGLRWLPAAIGAGIRAVVVDLDGTLYDGVLGEDGPTGVRIDPGHQGIARRLLELRGRGVVLGLVSMNDSEDVRDLFAARPDLLLRPEHFFAISAGWDPKTSRLRQIIDRVRVGPETVLFVDDNPGELAAVATEIPGLQCAWADPADPDSTERALRWYPGLDKLRTTEADALRVADLAVADRRDRERRGSTDPAEYLRSLHLVVTLAENPADQVERLHELSMKTNQFNTTLSRMSEGAMMDRMADPDGRVVSVALRDRLSDSGIVCGMVFRRKDGRIVVEEMALSCRALGRGVESLLVLAALRRVTAELGSDTVVFPFKVGPRNEPARRWLEEFTGTDPAETGHAVLAWNEAEANDRLAMAPIEVRWDDP